MEITSLQNQKVKQWLKLHQKKYRDKENLFLIEGEHLIEEAIQAGVLISLLISEDYENIFAYEQEVYQVPQSILDKLSQNVSQVSYIGVCRQKDKKIIDFDRLVFLDGIQDPGNMGTIIRSAYSFGYDAIWVGSDCVDIYNEKVIRATQGALFHIPIRRCNLKEAILQAKQEGVSIIATALTSNTVSLDCIDSKQRLGLVFGSEGAGVKKEILDLADIRMKIEMANFESLNVGVAASIGMYCLRKDTL